MLAVQVVHIECGSIPPASAIITSISMYHYNFVFFSTPDDKYKIDRSKYNTICALELENSDDCKLVTYPLDTKPLWVRYIFAIHNSAKIAQKVKLPFKRLWYPYYFDNSFKDEKPLCIVILNHNLPIDYLRYLKKQYTDCRLVMLHRDFLRVSQRANPELPQNPILDLEMTYDEGESAKYGFPHFNEYESKIDIPVNDYFESDVFFAGRAKDRLPALLDAYYKLSDAGLKVYYFLTGVPKEQQIELPGVEYAQRNMSYREMLDHTVNTKCVLEITQEGQKGYTSRFLEAVMYGKKIISNSQYLRHSKFYAPNKVQIVENMEDIDIDFIKEGNGFVDYNYQGEFSPFRVLDRIDEELVKKFGLPNIK